MTRTFTRSLGTSPLAGKQVADRAARFKDQVRELQKKPGSVSLLTVVSVEPPAVGVAAMSDADDPCAVAWVERIEAVREELWQALTARKKGIIR